MKNTLVVYYSNTGSNAYLAEKLAEELNADLEELKPQTNKVPWLMALSVMKLPAGLKPLSLNLDRYDRIILTGPIWMGQLISPLRGFIKKYRNHLSDFQFVTCCGSDDEHKNEKFGYAKVFDRVKKLTHMPNMDCYAFPIGLALPEEKKNNSEAIMNTRLSDNTFGEMMKSRLAFYLSQLKTQ